jgi:hypothetical protein
MHRAIEIIGLVELDLQVKRLGSFAVLPESLDTRSIAMVEVSPSDDAPSSHAARA